MPELIQPLVRGYLVACLFEATPRPILAINGEQGSGKSDTARRIGTLLDPSPASLQSPPKDVSAWIDMAANSAVISIDNISGLTPAISDSFCRTTTGDSLVKRKLYSDKDLVIYQFKRVIILNGINLTRLRDDLLDRIVPISLPVISPENRRYEEELESMWEKEHPAMLGGLFDLCANVLETLPAVYLAARPRMADFARILAAHDAILESNALQIYLNLINTSAVSSIEGDSFLEALAMFIDVTWIGSASELLEMLSSKSGYLRDGHWPNSAKQVTEKLVRTAPTLRKIGWEITNLGSSNHEKVTKWRIDPNASFAGKKV